MTVAASATTTRVDAEYRLRVARREELTPRLVRVVLEGDDLARFPDLDHADRCVRLAFPRRPDHRAPACTVAEFRAVAPRAEWPHVRTYTVRGFDPGRGELSIDFVVHGTAGVAGPWATSARPGDELTLLDPRGSYRPRPDVDAHVLVGDESVLPAIAVACEHPDATAPVRVFVEVDGPRDEIPLHGTSADLAVRWVHRDAGEDLVRVVRDARWPVGRVQAFVHGESGAVRALRRHVRFERDVGPELLSVSGYWRRGAAAETFQAEKQAELLAARSRA